MSKAHVDHIGIVVAAENPHGDTQFEFHMEAFDKCTHEWPKDLKIKQVKLTKLLLR